MLLNLGAYIIIIIGLYSVKKLSAVAVCFSFPAVFKMLHYLCDVCLRDLWYFRALESKISHLAWPGSWPKGQIDINEMLSWTQLNQCGQVEVNSMMSAPCVKGKCKWTILYLAGLFGVTLRVCREPASMSMMVLRSKTGGGRAWLQNESPQGSLFKMNKSQLSTQD